MFTHFPTFKFWVCLCAVRSFSSFCVLPIPLFLCKCLNLCSSAAKRKRKMKKELLHTIISVSVLLLYQIIEHVFVVAACLFSVCIYTVNYFHAWSALAVTCRYLHEQVLPHLCLMLSDLTVVWLLFLAIILLCVMKHLYCFQVMFLPTVTIPHSTSAR